MRLERRRSGRAMARACARACALVVALAIGLLAAVTNVARAHATLVSAEPAANSRLTVAPSRIRLVFSEPIERGMAQFTLAGADGQSRKLVVSGDPHDVHAVIAPVDALPNGSYRLLWRVVSADGHPIDGSFAFSVVGTSAASSAMTPNVATPNIAAPNATPNAAPANPHDVDVPSAPTVEMMPTANAFGPVIIGAPVVSSVLRGAAVGALMALAGVLLFMAVGHHTDPQQARAAQRVVAALSVLTPLLLAMHALAWAANTAPDQRLTGEWIDTALGTDVGRVEALRVGLAVLAFWGVVIARRPLAALVFAAAALAVSGATGHPAAIEPAIAIPMKAMHLLAAGAWLGGLIWLTLSAWRSTSSGARDAARVSAVALASVVLVAISGAVQTWLFLPSLDALLHSDYGRVVLAKIGGLLLLVAFGAYHRFGLLPQLDRAPATRHRLTRSVRFEIALMALVVLAGGLLAYVPPPTSH